ncbi:hypothetical protein GCM10010307_24980 [Streptomyces vastus]|uniref:Uncharacterized protein n=1 Tax=Streptomyces vastus TaxID=285451 RepID=A0ABP6D2H5_9ACTN
MRRPVPGELSRARLPSGKILPRVPEIAAASEAAVRRDRRSCLPPFGAVRSAWPPPYSASQLQRSLPQSRPLRQITLLHRLHAAAVVPFLFGPQGGGGADPGGPACGQERAQDGDEQAAQDQ